MSNLSNQPSRGTKDWLPEEFKIRQYIFNTWREVCVKYGFEEYLTPILENAQIYKAKSGEDVGGKELFIYQDDKGRELALRPEMTPSVTRMVSRIYSDHQKPLKYFSIANFLRNERPQRGRNREFWQLNLDIFGSESLTADIEVIQMSLDLMLAFHPPKNSFVLGLNHRQLLEDILTSLNIQNSDLQIQIFRVLDKYHKLQESEFKQNLQDLGVDESSIEKIKRFLHLTDLEELNKEFFPEGKPQSLQDLEYIIDTLSKLGYSDYIKFDPAIIRGLDYYDGVVCEVFDLNPENNRALFGGGRYNGLSEIFGVESFPGVGVAPGDEAIKLFLESWGLLENIVETQDTYFLPILDKNLEIETLKLAQSLREQGYRIEQGLKEQKMNKALEFANKKNISKVILLGQEEFEKGVYKIKDMSSSQEEERQLN